MPENLDNPPASTTASTQSVDFVADTNNATIDDSNNFFDKLAACLPPSIDDVNEAYKASDLKQDDKNIENEQNKEMTVPGNNTAINKVSEPMNEVFEQFKTFHETLITKKLDGFKTQKSELELLKEKIMKLEQRNNELEKKLTTNALNSKDNSLNDSINLSNNTNNLGIDAELLSINNDSKTGENLTQATNVVNNNINSSFTNINNSNNTQMSVSAVTNTTLLQQNTTNLVFNNLNKFSQNMQSNSSGTTNTPLKQIPNINQGGFIITSNGSIAYVPPNTGSNPTSTPIAHKTHNSSVNLPIQSMTFNDPISSSLSSVTNSNINTTVDDQLKIDFDSMNKNSLNIDMNSLFGNKNILNMNSTGKSVTSSPKTSPQKSENIKPKSSDSQQPTAFILSANGQLVPINNNPSQQIPVQSISSTSALTSGVPFILPKPQLLPKPSVPSTVNNATSLKSSKIKPIKSKATKKQKSQGDPATMAKTETTVSSTDNQSTAIETPTANQTTTTLNSAKHRAIRPKPSSNSNSQLNVTNTQQKNIQPKPVQSITIQNSTQPVLVLPSALTSPNNSSKQNYGIIKVNTVSPAKDNKNSNLMNLNNAIMLETNDILSKAASMIFSPSEFSLNNLSPSTNTTNNATSNTTMSPKNSTSAFLLQNLGNEAHNQTVNTNKIAIQRNHSQQSIAPKTSKQENLLKPAKVPISKNSKTKLKPKLVVSEPAKSSNKIAIVPNNSKQRAIAPSNVKNNQNKTLDENENILNVKSAVVSSGDSTSQHISISAITQTPQQPSESGQSATDLSQKQQDQFDMQIQLQLQSILNGTAIAQVNESPSKTNHANSNDKLVDASISCDKSNIDENKDLVQTKQKNICNVASEAVESMPSLDDFFSIGNEENLPSKSSPSKSQPKITKAKKVVKSKNVEVSEESIAKPNKKPILPKTSPEVTPSKKSVQIRSKSQLDEKSNKAIKPKPTKDSASIEKIKFELSDLDKVLQQVESIASLTGITSETIDSSETIKETSDVDNTDSQKPSTNNADFLFDLLNIENSSSICVNNDNTNTNSNNVSLVETPVEIPTGKSSKKNNLLKKSEKSATLSTPPPLNNQKPKKAKLNSNSKNTPIKSHSTAGSNLLDDNDFFSFLKETGEELKRTPLKPDNHIQDQILTKKRGRPPKSVSKTPDSLKNQSNSTTNDLDLSNSSESKKICNRSISDSEDIETYSNENNAANDTKCILNTAVENTFQDLINSKTDTFESFILNGKPREKSCENISTNNNANQNNKENTELNPENVEDFNNFVYDIAVNENSAPNTSNYIEEPPSTDITIASLMSTHKPHRKRGRSSQVKTTSLQNDNIKSKPVANEINSKFDVPCKKNSDTDNEDSFKKRKKSASEINENEMLVDFGSNSNELIEDKSVDQPTTIAALAASSILGNGEKRKRGRPTKQNSTQKVDETKAPNYKKINNPCGTTSLLALNIPPTNIEYAGLTRFEIPFETEEDKTDKSEKSSPVKQAKESEKEEITKKSESNLHSSTTETASNSDELIENIQKSIMNLTDGNNANSETNATNNSNNSNDSPEVSQKNDQKEILDNLYETAKSFHNENSFEKVDKRAEEDENFGKDLFTSTGFKAQEIANSDATSKEYIENVEGPINDSYWSRNSNLNLNENSQDTNNLSDSKKNLISKKTHMSHYDLENDPIINKDLQQLHNNKSDSSHIQQQKVSSQTTLPSHLVSNMTNQPLITPPSTVCSIPSSVSSNSSNTSQFSLNGPNNTNTNNNLSINPSSTSSTSSTQMISPVSSEIGVASTTNCLRNTSADQANIYQNTATNSYYSSSQPTQHQNTNQMSSSNSQQNTYFNGQYNNSQYSNNVSNTNKSTKSSTPTKYSNNSYSEANTSSHNLDLSVQHSQQHQQNMHNTSPQLINTNNLYRSNSANNLQQGTNQASNSKTPMQNSNPAQLNTSQSPQHRHSISLCSTPQPTTPQPSTTPNNFGNQNTFNHCNGRSSPNFSHQQQNTQTNIYQHNPFSQSTVLPSSFPLLPNHKDLYATPNFNHSQYSQHQASQHINNSQYNKQNQPKVDNNEQPSYMTNNTPSNNFSQNYYMNHHNNHSTATPTYLPNLLAPAYPQKPDFQPSGSTILQQHHHQITNETSKPAKSNKSEKKASTKQSKKASSSKLNTASTTPATAYNHQPANNYEKMMSMNALHAAANWYDFTSQVANKNSSTEAAAIASLSNLFQKQQNDSNVSSNHQWPTHSQHANNSNNITKHESHGQTGAQNSQYNSQFQKSSLNSLFAPSTSNSTSLISSQPKQSKNENVHRSNSQHQTAYQPQPLSQYQNNSVANVPQNSNYSTKTGLNAIPRSTSSTSLNENHFRATTTSHQQDSLHNSNFYQYQNISHQNLIHNHHQNQNQHNMTHNTSHIHPHQQLQIGNNNNNSINNNQFAYQNHHNQFNHPQTATNMHHGVGAAAHHHLANPALAFPHHPHHQAAAMNSLLANQFSNVPSFGWHPKI